MYNYNHDTFTRYLRGDGDREATINQTTTVNENLEDDNNDDTYEQISDSDYTLDENHPLYQDCEDLGGDHFIYAPLNELDRNLFNQLVTNETLLNIKDMGVNIATELSPGIDMADQYKITTLVIYDHKFPRCTVCKQEIPIDMDFYKNDCSVLCNICIRNEPMSHYYNARKISSGVENANDWVSIMAQYKRTPKPPNVVITDQCFYCNLNENSKWYGHFGRNTNNIVGDDFYIIPETTIEEIINKYIINHDILVNDTIVSDDEDDDVDDAVVVDVDDAVVAVVIDAVVVVVDDAVDDDADDNYARYK